MSRTDPRPNTADLPVSGTFALRRALDEHARPRTAAGGPGQLVARRRDQAGDGDLRPSARERTVYPVRS